MNPRPIVRNILYSVQTLIRIFVSIVSSRSLQELFATLKLYAKETQAFFDHLNAAAKSSQTVRNKLDSTYRKRLFERVQGLHSLLPNSPQFKYSILLPVNEPHSKYLKQALDCALKQTAPQFEVCVGLVEPVSSEILAILEQYDSNRLRVFRLAAGTAGRISLLKITQNLSENAQGDYLLLITQETRLELDLLYRLEQCLRLLLEPENSVLYCNEFQIDDLGRPVPNSKTSKRYQIPFPYVFQDFISNVLLVPKPLLTRSLSTCTDLGCNETFHYQICLSLDLLKVEFHLAPFQLCGVHKPTTQTPRRAQAGLHALSEYVKKKELNWNITPGLIPGALRASPQLQNQPEPELCVQIIIPFRNQKALTLKAVKSALVQKGVKTFVTAVDNASTDPTIAPELEKLGIEVLTVNEPFNYSRLNNIGAKKSRYASQCSLILFLNNDVDLKNTVVWEMAQWIHQPKIGIVGARLVYPNGLLQHGGVNLEKAKTTHTLHWYHTDGGLSEAHQLDSKVIHICDAVTAACALMQRKVFEAVGGFDEVWYPVAFSDTDLCVRLRATLGLYSLYTPYAEGVHFESASRGSALHEEMEASYWFYKNTLNRKIPQTKLKDPVLDP
jgi:GT2 family glycosyltransferase